MNDEKLQDLHLPCTHTESKNWHAWLNTMPPGPHILHVVGEVYVANPGVEAFLTPKVPQGINPSILLLDLHLYQRVGIWPQHLVWKTVRYEKINPDTKYTHVQIYCRDTIIADIPVKEVV